MNDFYTFYATGFKSIGDDLVEGYISTIDKDLVNDVVTPNCLVDMLSQLNKRNIKLDLEHEAFRGKSVKETELNKTIIPAAKIVDASLDVKGIKVVTKLNKNYPRYDMLKSNIKDGFIDAFSIAYVPEKVRVVGDERHLDKINLLNVAFTGNPVNPSASFTSVLIKSLNDEVSKGGIVMTDVKEQIEPKFEVKDLIDKFVSLESQVKELKDLINGKAEVKADEPMDDENEIDEEKKKKKKEKEDEEKKEQEVKNLEAKSIEVDKENELIKELNSKSLDLEVKLKSIEAKQAELDKVLSEPIFKARAEIMQKSLKENDSKNEVSRGVLDLIY